MRQKDTFLLRLEDKETGKTRVTEVPLFRGLSAEDTPGFESILSQWCTGFSSATVPALSSIRFALESAALSFAPDADTPFLKGEAGIPINGLIWMGDKYLMRNRIDEKLAAGFHVLKLKIGGINFDEELSLLRYIRSHYPASDLEIRLDANGSFSPDTAIEKLKALSRFDVHSIEQPLPPGQTQAMAELCRMSPIPIALDEELIGCTPDEEARLLLEKIRPAYIILKPALCGGFSGADMWIRHASELGIGWWATSALESNIGLEAIARWLTTRHNIIMPQGLGTGHLYENNFETHLELRGDCLFYNPNKEISLPQLLWKN